MSLNRKIETMIKRQITITKKWITTAQGGLWEKTGNDKRRKQMMIMKRYIANR